MKKSDETNVILKKFQNSDQEGYLRIAKDEGVKEFCNIFYAETLDDAEFVINMLIHGYLSFKIVERQSGKIVGAIIGDEITEHILDVSYFIAKDYRNKGYCTEAIKLFEQYVKTNTAIRALTFCIKNERDNQNKSSKSVMKKLNIPIEYLTMKSAIYAKHL